MENKNYYYLKLKENFFESDELKILESQENGYLYSNILLKLYLKALKNDGKLVFNEYIPYNAKMLATITGHNIDIVEKAIKVFQALHLIEILDNGTIFMLDMQKMIGSISSEGIRKAKYRERIDIEKKRSGTIMGQSPDILSYSISNSNSNIFNYWNNKKIIVHKELTNNINKAITKALEIYTEEEIKEYIDRYDKVLKDQTWFFNYKWTLTEFLNRKDGISSFGDEGSKWISYLDKKDLIKKSNKPKNSKGEQYSAEDLNVLTTNITDIVL